MTRPLSGITVVALEHAVAGPFATRQLADLGARVIKLERPRTGDFARQYDTTVHGLSSYFVWLNRSKESVALDVKAPEGREILHELVDHADVIVQNLGPGAANRLGLGSADVRARDSRKIILNITGWGSDGPWSNRKAYDMLVQGEAGVISLTGSPEQPARVGISIADIAAGMYGFSGVLAALYSRSVSGQGQSIEVSLFEALAEWMGQPMYYTSGSGTQQARFGVQHVTIAPYGPFITSDGRTLVIAIQNEAEWSKFCQVFLENAHLSTDPRFDSNSRRVANRDQLNIVISDRFAELDAASTITLLEKSNTAYAGMNSMHGLIVHPVLQARHRWSSIETPNGNLDALKPPIQFEIDEPRMDPVPELGEHTVQVLRELGRTSSEIDSLIEQEIVWV